jgi:hypothetical protein
VRLRWKSRTPEVTPERPCGGCIGVLPASTLIGWFLKEKLSGGTRMPAMQWKPDSVVRAYMEYHECSRETAIQNLGTMSEVEQKDFYLNYLGIYGFTSRILDVFKQIEEAFHGAQDSKDERKV